MNNISKLIYILAGAEFTKAQIHTANGVSIRFPRVTKIRDDKTWYVLLKNSIMLWRL